MIARFMLTQKRITSRGNCNGFTLIELMIAMAISGIVLMAVFKIYTSHQQHYAAQLDVTEMQQNIRAALNLLPRDIRMAGYQEPGAGVAKIEAAKPDLFYFTVDRNEDGDVSDTREHIAYDLYDSPTLGKPVLGRTSGSSSITVADQGGGHWEVDPPLPSDPAHQPAAENIEQLEFFYLDKDGDPTTVENQIRTVVISILARVDQPDPKFTNTQTYTPASNLAAYNTGGLSGVSWAVNDNYRRRMQIMRIDCRNVGLL